GFRCAAAVELLPRDSFLHCPQRRNGRFFLLRRYSSRRRLRCQAHSGTGNTAAHRPGYGGLFSVGAARVLVCGSRLAELDRTAPRHGERASAWTRRPPPCGEPAPSMDKRTYRMRFENYSAFLQFGKRLNSQVRRAAVALLTAAALSTHAWADGGVTRKVTLTTPPDVESSCALTVNADRTLSVRCSFENKDKTKPKKFVVCFMLDLKKDLKGQTGLKGKDFNLQQDPIGQLRC